MEVLLTHRLFLAAAVSALALGACSREPSSEAPSSAGAKRHKVVERIPGPDGGYDYLSVDSEGKKLFVAREFGVMSIDLGSGRVTPRLVEANDVSAVLVLPGTGLMLSTVYDGDKAIIFDRATGKIEAEIATGKSPDAAAFDPSSKLVFVMNAKSNDVTVIDPVEKRSVGTIAMGGKPEAAVADGRGRIFINIEDSAEIAVVDVLKRAVVARYKMSGCNEPTGIARDASTNTLVSACHNSTAKLIDAATGADRGSVPVGENADGAIFNPATRLAYVPSKDGKLTIFRLDDAAKAQDIETVETGPTARTAALDPSTGRIYLASAQARLDEKGEEQLVPGTFAIIVVAPE